MKMKPRRWRKGVILLQTLVMSVILSMIAVMVLKWVLGRYMLAARAFRSAKSYSHSEGYAGTVTSNWNFNSTPGGSGTAVEGQNISYTITGSVNGTNRVEYTSDEEDISN